MIKGQMKLFLQKYYLKLSKGGGNNMLTEDMQGIKSMTGREISMSLDISKEVTRKILKMYGLERITRKRFKKLLMGCGMQRNDAEIVASAFRESKIQYTPLAVQKVIETINIEVEKENTQNEMSRNV